MHLEINLDKKWAFHEGDIEVEIPSSKGPVYSQAKTECKLIGPASYGYFDIPDAYYRNSVTEISGKAWHYVDLPHDYIIAKKPDKNQNNAMGYFKYENAWYRKHFKLEEEWFDKRITLRFGGISGNAEIYLNGCFLKRNFSRYNSFEVDITDYVYFDKENILAIYVNAKNFEGWWYQGAGIYRSVSLVVTDPVAIDLYGVYAPCERLCENKWQINFETTVINSLYKNIECVVQSKVLDFDNNEIVSVQAGITIESRSKSTAKYSAVAQNPKLWDIDNPNLYTVHTTLLVDGKVSDENYTRIGFRTIEMVPGKGFLLNGQKVFLKGVCCHQDFGITGIAVPDNISKYKIRLIKEMGANAYRTSHYQQNDATMDALDELGFIVMAECRRFETNDESLEYLTTLVKRDRNRPSVVFWSTGNEEPLHCTENGRRIHKNMASAIRKLDKTRFIMSAQNASPSDSTIYEDCGVLGINYCFSHYDAVHEKFPEKLIVSSECCATGTTRGWYIDSQENGRIKDRDASTSQFNVSREHTWKYLTERDDYVIGGFQWIAIEHRGEAAWPALSSKSGAIDLFLQKKGAFYQNKSMWTDEPMVHIVEHWNFRGMENKPIDITVYTNCDEIELMLNGKSIARKKVEKYGHGEFVLNYEPGELKCIGYRNGIKVAEHIEKSAKTVKRLILTQDIDFKANDNDIGLFTCECVDEDGVKVRNATPFVKFSASKGAQIIGTGSDHCDHNEVILSERKMYAGKITVAVKSKVKKFSLYAECDDLGMAVLEVECQDF